MTKYKTTRHLAGRFRWQELKSSRVLLVAEDDGQSCIASSYNDHLCIVALGNILGRLDALPLEQLVAESL